MLHRALRLLRTYHQLKQFELAERLGVSNSFLSEIEKGTKSPSLEVLSSYSRVFKMPVSSILLFSESIDAQRVRSSRVRIVAADKILRILEWIEERSDVDEHVQTLPR